MNENYYNQLDVKINFSVCSCNSIILVIDLCQTYYMSILYCYLRITIKSIEY